MRVAKSDSDISIAFAGVEVVDALEPLWLSLFDHHRAVGPGPFINRNDSWPAPDACTTRFWPIPMRLLS